MDKNSGYAWKEACYIQYSKWGGAGRRKQEGKAAIQSPPPCLMVASYVQYYHKNNGRKAAVSKVVRLLSSLHLPVASYVQYNTTIRINGRTSEEKYHQSVLLNLSILEWRIWLFSLAVPARYRTRGRMPRSSYRLN